MTSIRKRIEAAEKAHGKITDAIYQYATHGHMPFSECHNLAPATLQASYVASNAKLTDLRIEAVTTGKAWRASFGMLVFYR